MPKVFCEWITCKLNESRECTAQYISLIHVDNESFICFEDDETVSSVEEALVCKQYTKKEEVL